MDLKVYYQKIRDIEKSIEDAFAVIVSLETPDGGKPGTLTEVSPGLAAKMIVEGVARRGNRGSTVVSSAPSRGQTGRGPKFNRREGAALRGADG